MAGIYENNRPPWKPGLPNSNVSDRIRQNQRESTGSGFANQGDRIRYDTAPPVSHGERQQRDGSERSRSGRQSNRSPPVHYHRLKLCRSTAKGAIARLFDRDMVAGRLDGC
jgi:hypothetical protein